ncbi:MFS transporter [Alistipes sp.]|uniref:MFS transporter n=1 Tax=Alistipes sp. TaxID=1872444 RepID=UPI003AEF7E5E
MDTMPLRWGHFRVLIVASLGQVLGAGLATLVGIILPMIQLLRHAELSSLAQGAVACTSLVGIMVGSVIFGEWSDRKGYLLFFRLCPLVVLAASLLAFLADNLAGLVVGLFLMGLGIGGEYSLDSDYISEIMPRRWRLMMVGVAKASSSVGNIVVAGISFFLLSSWDDPRLWNRLLLLVSVFSLAMFLSRIRFEQSPGWLFARDRDGEAERAVQYFLGKDVEINELRNRPRRKDTPKVGWSDLFRRGNIKKVLFSGIPWACEGVGVYGIGVFLPVLILALGLESVSEAPFARIIHSVQLTTYINLFILPGFVLGLVLVNRWYHVRTQTWGFLLCAAGMALLLAAYELHWPVWIAVAGFMLFELFLNAGPHLMTFIIPPQIYSVAERGAGAGLAAAFGKLGAVVGVLFIPMLLEWGGAGLALLVTIATQLLGALITAVVGHKVLPNRGSGYRPELRHDR